MRHIEIMMQDYYGIYTILSSYHEFVIMMLDYYGIDIMLMVIYSQIVRFSDTHNLSQTKQLFVNWLSYLGQLTMLNVVIKHFSAFCDTQSHVVTVTTIVLYFPFYISTTFNHYFGASICLVYL